MVKAFVLDFLGFSVLLYAVCNFFYEILLNQLRVQGIWFMLSLGQKAAENQVLCLQDLNFLIALGLFLWFIKWRSQP